MIILAVEKKNNATEHQDLIIFSPILQVGVAIKPGTPVADVEKYINISDMVLIMTVEPGFGGQKFMEDQMAKVQYLRNNYPLLDIEVDGGVGPSTIDCCAKVCHLLQVQ